MTKEEKRDYDRKRYLIKRAEQLGDRKCLACGIFLRSEKWGAYNSRLYCRMCIDRGAARRDQNRRAYKRNRKKIIARVTKYQQEHREERNAYFRKYLPQYRKNKRKQHEAKMAQST